MLIVQHLHKISHDSGWFKIYDASRCQYDFSSRNVQALQAFSLLVFAHIILSKPRRTLGSSDNFISYCIIQCGLYTAQTVEKYGFPADFALTDL